MFIFDAIIGIPIAVWGFWAIPDLPHNTRAFYFTEEVGVVTLTMHKGTRS
jgi:ACS family pantothenate transporter-like MFS transporter